MTASSPDVAQPLRGLVAVVTGGAGRIGTEIGRQLADGGAAVVAADLDGERAERRAAALVADGHESLGVQIDIGDEASVIAAFAAVTERFGGVDVLVNNAAPTALVRDDAPAADVSLELWDTMLHTIVRGTWLCTRAAIPLMLARGGGAIVNTSSIQGHLGDRDITAYPVAKAAILQFTRAVATQYGRQGIRCNSVTPGSILPPTLPQEFLDLKTRHQLIPRLGTEADVARVVAFLVAPESSFLTGHDYPVEGGLLSHLPGYADTGATVPPV
jgi:NAD(P)-dependent dehydrogenase (short-subunit alcohol dehydrogenase family)